MNRHEDLIIEECLRQGVIDKQCIAYVLATASIESAGFRRMTEMYNGDPYEYFEGKYGRNTRVGKILGNTQEGDGYTFRGRGYVQITGRYNYTQFGLVSTPDLAKQPGYAAEVLVKGMRDGSFTGKKLSQYMRGLEGFDIEGARDIVNPGEGSRRLKEFTEKYNHYLTILNLD